MDDAPQYSIRSYQASDRGAVRKLCCETGFLGDPIDPVFQDRELFADFLTTYYTDHEPESSFVLEIDGKIRGYLLGSRKPLQHQVYAFAQTVLLFFRALRRYRGYNVRSRKIRSLGHWPWLARSPRRAQIGAAFSHQPAAGRAKSFHHPSSYELVPELPLSIRRAPCLWPDRDL